MEFLNPKKKKYNFDKFLEEEKPEKPVTIYDDPEWKDLVETVKRQAEEDIEENNKPKFLRRKVHDDMPKPPAEPEQVELNIRLTLPKVKWEKAKDIKKWLLTAKKNAVPYLKNRRVQQIGVGILALLIFIFVVSNLLDSKKKEPLSTATNGATTQSANTVEPVSHDVPFKMFLPDKDLPKEAVSYNASKNFAKFDDQINGVTVSVTEQPLPANFKSNPATSLEDLAKQMNATESIETTTAGTIYVQQIAQGSQTAIFVRDNILGFIRTQNEVGASKIAMYIDSLK